MDWESSGVVRFDLGPLLQGQTSKTKLKSAYNSLIIGPRDLGCEIELSEIMGRESSGVVRFDLGPFLQGETRIAKLKSAYNLLIIGPRGFGCETNLWEIMAWESSGVVRFNLGALLHGQTRIAKHKSAYNSLILVLEVCHVKTSHRKSWAGNLLMWLNLTFSPSFKVKRG